MIDVNAPGFDDTAQRYIVASTEETLKHILTELELPSKVYVVAQPLRSPHVICDRGTMLASFWGYMQGTQCRMTTLTETARY